MYYVSISLLSIPCEILSNIGPRKSSVFLNMKKLALKRASFCKYQTSGASFEIFNFFIFCPNKAFSELFSKIQLKDPKALEFFQNRGKFENRHFGFPPSSNINQNDAFCFSLVLVNAIASSNVRLANFSTSLALSKTLDYSRKAVKLVFFLAVLVTP